MWSLNAPFGARCFLTRDPERKKKHHVEHRLNAPFGARCFLTYVFHSDYFEIDGKS